MNLVNVGTYVTSNRKPAKRALLTIFFVSLSYLFLLYNDIYPLFLTWNSGFLDQIPLVFWPVLGSVIVSGISYCALAASRARISGVMIIVFMAINYTQFLFFNFTGGDSAGEISRWYSIRDLPRFSSELFTYFQWPMHFTFFESYNEILGLALIDTMRLSYLTLYFLFIISIFYFTYKYTSGTTYWLAASIYVIYMTMFLNNQLVPQLFALVILIYLVGFETDSGRKSIIIQIFLCTFLYLSHPFFFVFYLLSISIAPFIRSVRTQLSTYGNPTKPLYYSIGQTLLNPISATRGVVLDGAQTFKNEVLRKLTLLSGIYLFLLKYQFPDFQQEFYNEFTGSISPNGSGSLLARLPEIIFSSEGATSTGPEITLLYRLSPEFLHSVSIYMILAILGSLLIVAVGSLLMTDTENILVIPISMAAAGTVYYIGGFFFSIIGPRSYQIIFLAIGVIAIGHQLDSKVVKIVVLIALVASPIIGVNIIINASVAGGGNSQNLHAHAAGQHFAQHDAGTDETTVKYPHAGLPPEFTYEQNLRITTVEELILQEGPVEDPPRDPSIIIFGPRQGHVAAHYTNECNFEPSNRHILYDNNISILADSSSVSGLNCVSSS